MFRIIEENCVNFHYGGQEICSIYSCPLYPKFTLTITAQHRDIAITSTNGSVAVGRRYGLRAWRQRLVDFIKMSLKFQTPTVCRVECRLWPQAREMLITRAGNQHLTGLGPKMGPYAQYGSYGALRMTHTDRSCTDTSWSVHLFNRSNAGHVFPMFTQQSEKRFVTNRNLYLLNFYIFTSMN